MPEIGQVLKIPEGIGKVVSIEPLSNTYRVDIPDVGIVVVKAK
jgi:hypothetical protein